MCLMIGRGLRHPDRRRCASSTSTARARRCRTRTPACWRSSPSRLLNGNAAADLRGRAAAARLRQRARRRARLPARARGAARRRARCFNVGSGQPLHDPRGRRSAGAACSASDASQPEITGKYRVGDIRHCFADIARARERPRLRAAGAARGGPGRARRLARRARSAIDRVGAGARASSRARGLTRMSPHARDRRTARPDHRRRRLHRHQPRAPAARRRAARCASSTTSRARASSGTCAGCASAHGDRLEVEVADVRDRGALARRGARGAERSSTSPRRSR